GRGGSPLDPVRRAEPLEGRQACAALVLRNPVRARIALRLAASLGRARGPRARPRLAAKQQASPRAPPRLAATQPYPLFPTPPAPSPRRHYACDLLGLSWAPVLPPRRGRSAPQVLRRAAAAVLARKRETSGMFKHLGRFVAAHPWVVCAAWLLAGTAAALTAPPWDGRAQDDDIRFLPPACDSVGGYRLLGQAFPQGVFPSPAAFALERAGRGPPDAPP